MWTVAPRRLAGRFRGSVGILALAVTACTATPAAPTQPAALPVPASVQSTTTSSDAAAAAPLMGEWLRTNPDLGELLVMPGDLIWGQDAFYLMLRVGFGDVRVWKSANGVDWSELPGLGVVSSSDRPRDLLSVGGRLVAAGSRDGQATVWIYEGTSPWREVRVGVSAWVRDFIYFDGRYVLFGVSPFPLDDTQPRHATIWVSEDAEEWSEVVGVELFGANSRFRKIVVEPTRIIAATRVDDPVRFDLSPQPLVAASSDGITWTTLDEEEADSLLDDPVWSLSPVAGSPVSWVAQPAHNAFRPEALGAETLEFMGRRIMVGTIYERRDGLEDPVTYPGVWSYVEGDVWQEVGPLAGLLAAPGTVAGPIAGDDRMVAVGWSQAPEFPNGAWSIFTFIPDEE